MPEHLKEPRLCKIVTSEKKDKKYDAIFREKGCPCKTSEEPKCGGGEKIVSFGAKGMSDFTKHGDEERKERYLDRHRKNEDWNDPLTPGALSRWILWNKPTLKASIDDFKKRFKL
jgi:hypothetical protein